MRVSPTFEHIWVDQSTGVFHPGESSQQKTLKQLMLDGYEALSGTRYVPQTAARPLRSSAGQSMPYTSSQIKDRIQSHLRSMDNEEIFKLLTDSQAFNQELQSWLRETEAGKTHRQVHKALLQAAQSSKDLAAVRFTIAFVCGQIVSGAGTILQDSTYFSTCNRRLCRALQKLWIAVGVAYCCTCFSFGLFRDRGAVFCYHLSMDKTSE
jgi:hypothetical protein